MKKLMMSALVLSLTAGCAIESDAQENAAEAELSVTPNYRPQANNFVHVCSGLALRSCDSKATCDTGVRLAAHSVVFSDFQDPDRDTAHLTAPPGWVALHSPSGLSTLETVDGPCI